MTDEQKKDKKFYRRRAPIVRFGDWINLKILYPFNEKIRARVFVQTGEVITAVVDDWLIKKRKSGKYESHKCPFKIDDEIPEESLKPTESNQPSIDILFHQGTGRIEIIGGVTGGSLNAEDIRVNDIFEQILSKIFKMFELDKEKKWFFGFVIGGIIAMGLFFAFGVQALIQLYIEAPKLVLEGKKAIEQITAPLLFMSPKLMLRGKKWISKKLKRT